MVLALGLFGIAILSGVVLCALGVYCYRRWDEPGVAAFAGVAICLGAGAISGGLTALILGPKIPDMGVPLWATIGLTGWVFAMIPWILFALQYTGRYTRIRRRTIAAISVPVVGLVTLLTVQMIGGDSGVGSLVVPLLGTMSFLYVLSLLAIGGYLLLRTTSEYGHLSLYQGVSLALAGSWPLVVINSLGVLTREAGDGVVFGVYALAFLMPAVTLTLAVFRYDMFDSTPAVGALGERAIPRETDDLVFVVDKDDRVIKLNARATDALDTSPTAPLGDPFAPLVGSTVEELQQRDTIELETAVGTRKFDPQVSAFTDQHDRRLGYLLSLRDVTKRELRKQRLEVLNRVLRHNLRNRVDVIKSNAEAVADDSDSEYADAIRESADGLAQLSSKARETDKLVSRPARESEADLAAEIRGLVDTVDCDIPVTLPESAPLVTDWEALRSAVRSAFDNAIEHADESVTVSVESLPDGYVIIVDDDGPGIPESELASLDAETETPLQHGTGLGLWQLKWSVTKLNGTLSFDTDDGTTIRMTVPDRSG